MADLERSQEQSRREMDAMDELADLRYALVAKLC
jgi:flagellar biosynthesis chaperone FliJ